MRVSIQVGSNELVIRGDANFVSKMAYAVEVYEGKREREVTTEIEKETTGNFKDRKKMLETLEKARAVKAQKAKLNVLPSGKKRPKPHRAPRWTEDEDKKLNDFLIDEDNYRYTRGKFCIHTPKMRALARDLRRTTKAVSLRITGEKKFRDLRDYMKQKLVSKRSKTGNSSWTTGWA